MSEYFITLQDWLISFAENVNNYRVFAKPYSVNERIGVALRRHIWQASWDCRLQQQVITELVSGLLFGRVRLLGTFHAAAAAATPTVLSPTAGMTTFPIHGAVTQPTVFSPNALQPFAGSSKTCLILMNYLLLVYLQCWCCSLILKNKIVFFALECRD